MSTIGKDTFVILVELREKYAEQSSLALENHKRFQAKAEAELQDSLRYDRLSRDMQALIYKTEVC